jgi:hypothetical protein
MITATVTGVDEAIADSRRIIHPRMYDKMMDEIVKDTVSLIRSRCPVDTGALLNTIRSEKSGDDWKIVVGGDGVDYAEYLEYGFKSYRGGTIESPKFMKTGYQPFIRSSIWEVNNMFPNYIRSIIFKK